MMTLCIRVYVTLTRKYQIILTKKNSSNKLLFVLREFSLNTNDNLLEEVFAGL